MGTWLMPYKYATIPNFVALGQTWGQNVFGMLGPALLGLEHG